MDSHKFKYSCVALGSFWRCNPSYTEHSDIDWSLHDVSCVSLYDSRIWILWHTEDSDMDSSQYDFLCVSFGYSWYGFPLALHFICLLRWFWDMIPSPQRHSYMESPKHDSSSVSLFSFWRWILCHTEDSDMDPSKYDCSSVLLGNSWSLFLPHRVQQYGLSLARPFIYRDMKCL